jgi:hypothetical protein
MKKFQLILVFCIYFGSAMAQVYTISDPDSVLSEWLEMSEWEGISLHPDIAMDWILDCDTSSYSLENAKRITGNQMFTLSIPTGANFLDWTSDSGKLISPVSFKYRLKASNSKHWDFRFQTNRVPGDTCFILPKDGLPEHMTMGFLICPGDIFREIIAGDFQVNSGFGAVVGSSPVFSVSMGNPGSLHRPGKGIRLYSGVAEGRFFRGVAGTMKLDKSELNFYGSGKDQVHEKLYGAGYKKSFLSSEFGFTGIHVKNLTSQKIKEGWSSAWQPDSGSYSRLGFWGQTKVPFGIVFGELGWSPIGGCGWITGVRWFDAHGFSAVLRLAGCSPGYPVTYTLFQQGASVTKEGQRVILSYKYAPARKLEILGSIEVGMAKWPGANDRFLDTSTRISQQLKLISKNLWSLLASFQLDFHQSEEAVPEKLVWKMAFDSDSRHSGKLRFRMGVRQQIQGFGNKLTCGTTADSSISWSLLENRLRITSGLRIFTVESGSDPLYAYEPDVLYGFSAPVLTGSGTRWFLTLRWKFPENLDFEFKVSQTTYSDISHLSEGNQGGVSGKVQVSWRIS